MNKSNKICNVFDVTYSPIPLLIIIFEILNRMKYTTQTKVSKT